MKTHKELYYEAAKIALDMVETHDKSYGKRPDTEQLTRMIFSDLLENRRATDFVQSMRVTEVPKEEPSADIEELLRHINLSKAAPTGLDFTAEEFFCLTTDEQEYFVGQVRKAVARRKALELREQTV